MLGAGAVKSRSTIPAWRPSLARRVVLTPLPRRTPFVPRSSSPHDPSSTRSSIAPSVIAGRVWAGRSVCRLELEPELHGQPPRSLGKALWPLGQALIRPDDVHHGVDEREVGERLREVAQVASAVRLALLGVEQQRAGVGEQLLAQRPGPVQLADLRGPPDEPERAESA